MQPSELVTEEVLRQALAGYDHRVWASRPLASFEQAMRAALEAVALDLYERGLRVAAEIARNACLVPPDGGSPTPEDQAVAQAAHDRILSKLRAPT